ncbi:hypothetical protein Tco_1077237, partial [Tanacetum coccineum]
ISKSNLGCTETPIGCRLPSRKRFGNGKRPETPGNEPETFPRKWKRFVCDGNGKVEEETAVETRGNRKIRIPIALWPCKVEEKMTLKEVNGQTVKEIETKIIAKDGTITRVPGKFQGYETSEEEPVEQPRRHDLYGFVDHPQLQQGNPMNEFAPHRLPQPKGNMNGWLIEDEEEVERNEVDSDLKSTASSKPVWEKTTKDDHDRVSRNCPWCSM